MRDEMKAMNCSQAKKQAKLDIANLHASLNIPTAQIALKILSLT